MATPEKLRIPYEPGDWGSFRHIGTLSDGRLFLAGVTSAFPGPYPYRHIRGDWRNHKRWLAVLHTFDSDGMYLASDVRLGGLESEGRDVAGNKAAVALTEILSPLTYELTDIAIRVFETEVEGIHYSLKYESGTDDAGEPWEWVMLFPNAIMFHPPWDSGLYST